MTDVVFNSTVWAVLAGDIGVTVYVPLYNEITAWEYIAQPVSMNAMGGTVFGGGGPSYFFLLTYFVIRTRYYHSRD